jgi:hypothetical protein
MVFIENIPEPTTRKPRAIWVKPQPPRSYIKWQRQEQCGQKKQPRCCDYTNHVVVGCQWWWQKTHSVQGNLLLNRWISCDWGISQWLYPSCTNDEPPKKLEHLLCGNPPWHPLCPPPASSHRPCGEEDPVSIKKFKQEDGLWATWKELLLGGFLMEPNDVLNCQWKKSSRTLLSCTPWYGALTSINISLTDCEQILGQLHHAWKGASPPVP